MFRTIIFVCIVLNVTVPLMAQTTHPLPSQYQSFAMTHLGDPVNGRSLFNDRTKLNCFSCHSVDNKGPDDKVGQPLFAVGDKFGRSDLVEAILHPSASIAVGYSTTTIRTRSGDVIQGILRESTDKEIALRQADGKLARIALADIASQQTTDVSLMPEGLQNALTQNEFADLIEYLASLKVPENLAAIGHGMPPTIAELEKPMGLVPFSTHKFEHPCWFGPAPEIPDTFGVVEHESGKIWLLKHNDSTDEATVFLETGKFQTGTRGLVSMLFHPDFRANGRYFYVKEIDTAGHHHAMFYQGQADESRQHDSGQKPLVLFDIEMSANYHYGSGMAFGPDGYLYVGVGDTGPQGDPNGNAQNRGIIKGKMLRIDVDHPESGKPYSIPPDNPFVNDKDFRPEIWAYGLRMPWRISFDPLTHELWEGEVGQDLYEEVNIIHRGVNYGWNVIEGFEPYSNKYRRDNEKLTPPVFAYSRKYGACVTGGYVYRADPKSSFYGVYIFGDYVSSRLFGLTQENGMLKEVRQLAVAPQHAVSIGRDVNGELFLVGYEGTIYRMDLKGTTFK